MKTLINDVKAIIALIGLVGFLVIVLQFRPIMANQHSSGSAIISSTEAYPPPNSLMSLSEERLNPYPSADNVEVEESTVCSKAGQWINYQNKIVGFSFQYPSETQVQELARSDGDDAISFDLKTECYSKDCWGLNGVSISIFDNPKNLSLREFVEKKYNPNASTAYAISENELDKNIQSIIIGGEQALLVRGTLTYERPQAYILHNGLFVVISMTERSKGIWMDEAKPPCKTALELFDKILASVNFSQP